MEKLEFIAKDDSVLFNLILSVRPTLNFSMLKTILRKKDIKLNGKKVLENVEVKKGDTITVYLPDKKEKKVEVVFEDQNIIIANKPQGMEVTKKDKVFLDSECLEEVLNATACHRLDKNTEGLVVLAKNKTAEKLLLGAFKNHDIKKKYSAIVFGKINKNGQKLSNFLQKNDNFVKILDKKEENSQTAKMSYVVKKQNGELFEIEVDLETGRTHQIRAQLAHYGIFVLGDEKYGDKAINKKYHKSKQQLCAYKITFQNMPYPLQNLSNKTFEIKPTFCIEYFEHINL